MTREEWEVFVMKCEIVEEQLSTEYVRKGEKEKKLIVERHNQRIAQY